MSSTQDFLAIKDIKEDLVLLSDGSFALIIQTSAVNFDLLSETEQMAIIGSFAGLLNSLSFSIQIFIRSKRLDISAYLKTLEEAEGKQSNPLLSAMMQYYRSFVATIIRENEVLDKQFYVILSISPLELGVMGNAEKNFQKAVTILTPRKDHIVKQLGRIGLKSIQLTNEKLIKLFFDLYNDSNIIKAEDAKKAAIPVTPTISKTISALPPQPITPPKATPLPIQPQQTPLPPLAQSQPLTTPPSMLQTPQLSTPLPQSPSVPKVGVQNRTFTRSAPFVVEELTDDYGRA